MRRFDGRRALVTGASRGIGAGIAERLAAEGAAVAIVARTAGRREPLPGSLQETADRMARHGGTVAQVVADLSDPADRARIVPEAERALGGPVDILVHNAAAAIFQGLPEYPRRRVLRTFEVNVFAALELAQAVIPAMRAQRAGWIVNLSSGSAQLRSGPPFDLSQTAATFAIYGASKAALNRLTNALGAELYGTGIRANTVEPRAAVLSPGADALVGDQLRSDQIESLEEMVEAAAALCECPEEMTGGVHVSLDLLAQQGATVMGLDGQPLPVG